MTNYRSAEAKAYRRHYKTKAWRERRMAQLVEHPLCAWCERQGIVRGATVADHITPHRGDTDLFHFGELQSLCASCHSSAKQRQERTGWDVATDLNGYPIDLAHPANRTVRVSTTLMFEDQSFFDQLHAFLNDEAK